MKANISVQTGLSIALAVIFLIAIALIINLLFPFITPGGCMKGQRLNIEEIDSLSQDAIITGTTYVTKFKIEDCVECMWNFFNQSIQKNQIKIRWVGMSTTDGPVLINVSVPWNIGENDEGTEFECSSQAGENIKGNTMLVLEITSSSVNKLQS